MGHRRQLDDTPMRIYEFGPFRVDLQLGSLGADNSFDSLREEVRFKDLMRRVGLLP
jgi:hypothetical protein